LIKKEEEKGKEIKRNDEELRVGWHEDEGFFFISDT
jgi:hypothetical protein